MATKLASLFEQKNVSKTFQTQFSMEEPSRDNPYLKYLDFSIIFCFGCPYKDRQTLTIFFPTFLFSKIAHGGLSILSC